MKTFSVGEVQKNFARVLKNIDSGEAVMVTKHGKPVAKISALGPKQKIVWPNFYEEAVELNGEQLSDIIIQSREDRI